MVRFERDERAALRPLPVRARPRCEQRLRRRVATDAFVDIDTVRNSVPHRLVRDHVDVVVDERSVTIFHGPRVVATHTRSTEPFARVVDPTHYDGLCAGRPSTLTRLQRPPSPSWAGTWRSMRPLSRAVSDERRRACARRRAAHAATTPLSGRPPGCLS